MIIEDAYAELGLSPGAGEALVKAAWRRLVSQWHPDRNKTASALARMQRINTAYERLLLAGFERDSTAANDTEAAPPDQDAEPQAPIFRSVRLSLEEAALGCTKVLRGKVTADCKSCDSRGYRVLAGACTHCEGSGVIRQSAWYGWVSTTSTCDACEGQRMARQTCDACGGVGRHTRTYRQTVRIAAGVRHGDVLHAAGAAGPFELRVELLAHKFFVLDDDAILRCQVPVDGFAWMANRWVEVPTLTGMQQMRLKREHHVYRLRGQGFPSERGGVRGDYVVTVAPVFPDALNADQEALLQRLTATQSGALRKWHRIVHAWERGRRKAA